MNSIPIPQPDTERILSDLESLKVYFDPLRKRITQALAAEPRTIHQVADLLKVPFTRLYYQFNLLEKHGIIRVVATRAFSGAVEEKLYQVSARMFVIDRALLTPGEEPRENGLEVLLRYVLQGTRDDIHHSVARGHIDLAAQSPHPSSMLLRRGIYRMTPERAREFHERLLALLTDFASEGGSDGDYYAITAALYPSAFPLLEPPTAEGGP